MHQTFNRCRSTAMNAEWNVSYRHARPFLSKNWTQHTLKSSIHELLPSCKLDAFLLRWHFAFYTGFTERYPRYTTHSSTSCGSLNLGSTATARFLSSLFWASNMTIIDLILFLFFNISSFSSANSDVWPSSTGSGAASANLACSHSSILRSKTSWKAFSFQSNVSTNMGIPIFGNPIKKTHQNWSTV